MTARWRRSKQVVEHYDHGGVDRPSRSDLMKPLGLTSQEKTDLVAFLKTLTSDLSPTACRSCRADPPSRTFRISHAPIDPAHPRRHRRPVGRRACRHPGHPSAGARVLRPRASPSRRVKRSPSSTTTACLTTSCRPARATSSIWARRRPGTSTDVTFKEAGDVQVICAIHPRMKMTVKVTRLAGRSRPPEIDDVDPLQDFRRVQRRRAACLRARVFTASAVFPIQAISQFASMMGR